MIISGSSTRWKNEIRGMSLMVISSFFLELHACVERHAVRFVCTGTDQRTAGTFFPEGGKAQLGRPGRRIGNAELAAGKPVGGVAAHAGAREALEFPVFPPHIGVDLDLRRGIPQRADAAA